MNWRSGVSETSLTRLPRDSRHVPTARKASAIGPSKGAPTAAAMGAAISSSSDAATVPTRSNAAAKAASDGWLNPRGARGSSSASESSAATPVARLSMPASTPPSMPPMPSTTPAASPPNAPPAKGPVGERDLA